VIVSPGRLSAVFARAATAVPTAQAAGTPQPVPRPASPGRPQQEAQIITEVWNDMLGVNQVGGDDNFFELGGDSLIAIQLVARINERLGTRVTVADLFEQRTVANLAALVRQPGPGPGTPSSPSALAGSVSAADRRELVRKRREQQRRHSQARQ
jgi:acyl carrier protein